MISLFLFTHLALVAGAPVPNSQEMVSFTSAPNTRGTLSILFSCAAALILCVWTGVHLNVDPIENKRRKLETVSKFLGKTVWAMIGLFLPDIVLAIALHQLLVALEYRRGVNEKSTTKIDLVGKEVPVSERRTMTLKTAFFAIMGGFSMEVNTVEGPKRISLNVKAIDNIGMMDRIHDYPLSDIEDKSKASGIAKFVACIQAGWILLQCLGRLLDGLYITLLELNTAVHVILAIAMYCIWWEKPADINRPIIIDRRGAYNLTSTAYRNCVQQVLEAAGMAMENSVKNRNDNEHDRNNNEENTGLEHKEAWVTAIVCESIKNAPEETSHMIKLLPHLIANYFKKVLKSDVCKGVIEAHRYKRSGRIPLPVVQEAFGVAFKVAHESAFKVAQRNVYHTIHQLADADTSTVAEEKLKKTLDNAYKATRKITFAKALKAAYDAALQESKSLSATSTTAAPQQPTPGPTPTEPGVEKWQALKAAIRAAHAATRSATRQAVRLAALSAALDKTTAAAAARKAFRTITTKHCRDAGLDTSAIEAIDDNIQRIVNALGRAVEEAFREQYRTGANRANIGSDVNTTCELVKEATFTGIYNAACVEIERAVAKEHPESDVGKACAKAQEELRALVQQNYIPPSRSGEKSAWVRFSESLITAGDVVGDQLIYVPDLFWRQGGAENTVAQNNAGENNAGEKGKAQTTQIERSPLAFRGSASITERGAGTLTVPPATADTRPATADAEDFNSTEEHFIGNTVFTKSWRRNHRTILLLFAGIVGVFYGAIHLTKWNSRQFPSQTEQLLWRIAGCIGSATIVPLAALAFVPFAPTGAVRKLCIAFCALTWSAFLLARAYIIIESFVSLRLLPRDAFVTVQWVFSIPHL